MDIIELDNGVKLFVEDAVAYDNKTYILVKIMEGETVKEGSYVYEKGPEEIVEVDDINLANQLIKVFEKRRNLKNE